MKPSLWLAMLVVAVAGIAHADSPKPAPAPAAARPPHGARSIDIDYTWLSFQHDEWHAKLVWDGTAYASDTKRVVDAKLVDALYASLVALHDEAGPLGCMSHTDDYPEFAITIDGDEPLTIGSRSNCHAYVPWNITRGGKQLAQFDGSVWTALGPLLAATADRWKRGGNSPGASMGLGSEMVSLGEYANGTHAHLGTPGDAPACAHSFEGSPQARAVFGDAISIDELQLVCDLGTSADCSAPDAEATLAWQGLSARVRFACTAGTASLSAAELAPLTQLSAFVASKPVRELVALSASPPRLWSRRNWSVEGDGAGLPMLTWSPGTTEIAARTVGEAPSPAYWKAIGLDPTKLVHKREGYPELDVKLDFAGKRVP